MTFCGEHKWFTTQLSLLLTIYFPLTPIFLLYFLTLIQSADQRIDFEIESHHKHFVKLFITWKCLKNLNWPYLWDSCVPSQRQTKSNWLPIACYSIISLTVRFVSVLTYVACLGVGCVCVGYCVYWVTHTSTFLMEINEH
jgi:hypothetical protein